MCGIVGIWHKDKRPIDVQILTRMRDAMYFRGPNDSGIWVNGAIGFGHRRLSIIDLSSLGHQPMIDEESGAVIVYNGEVYNYPEIKSELENYGFRFKSKTDTEVVLKAYRKWGGACVNRFIGMFSFAIFDPQLKGIFLARDRIGIKPLYYFLGKDTFIFASRLSALMVNPACPQDIDPEALGLYLDTGFVPAPWSILKGVNKLRPGYTLWIDEKGFEINCYWDPSDIKIDTSLKDDEEIIGKFDSLLHDVIKRHLISDVPLGAFLSGGTDSSLVAAIMSRYTKTPPETFTIGFKEKRYNESAYAKNIAEYLGTKHNERIMQSNDLLSLLDKNTFYYDEPLADCSTLPTMMVSQFAKENVTVCLSGDGGDELFAGYHPYLILFYLRRFYNLPHSLRFILGKAIAKISSRKYAIIGESFAQKDALESFAFMRNINRGPALLDYAAPGIKDLFWECSVNLHEFDKVTKSCRLDLAYYLPDDILQKVDVASMSVSLEARVPLLDHRIVEFALSLPLKYKLRGKDSKWLVKKVLSKYIPPKLFQRPKKGFVAPIDKWFRAELKEMVQDELSSSRIKQFGYLKPEAVKQSLDAHMSNKADTQQILWAILSLLRWNDRFKKKIKL